MEDNSEARYRALFEATLDGIMIVDDQGRYVDVNDSLCRLLKAPRERLIGAHFSEFIPSHLLESASTDFRELKEFGRFAGEFPMRALDGSLVELDWTSQANFVPGLHFCVARDITARKQSEARKAAILETALDAIITMDHGGRVLEFNPAAERMFGCRLGQVLGQPLAELIIPPALRERHYRGLAHYLSTGERSVLDQRLELSALRADGSEFPVELTITRIRTEGPPVFTGYIRDLSERKQAEGRLACEHAVTRVLASATTLEEAAPALLRTLCEGIDGQLGQLWELEEGGTVLRLTAAWAGFPDPELERFQAACRTMTFKPGVGLPGRVWQERQAVTITELGDDRNFPRFSIAQTAGLHGGVAFPLLTGGEFFGVLEFFMERPFEPDAAFMQMMTAISHDIGQFIRRRRAEQALAAERERLQVTLTSIGDAVLVTDAAGRPTFLNPVAETLTGWPQDEAAGRTLEEVFRIVNEQTRQPAENPVTRVLREGMIVGLANHTLLITRDGAERPIDDSAAPIRDEAGNIGGVVLVFRDVTERRRRERELAEADRRKDEFLAMLAHELRNPLGPIRNALHLLRLQPGDVAAVDRWRDMMERQVGHMTRLVDDLLDVSRINRGKISLQRQRLDLGRLVQLNMDDHRHALEQAGLGIEVKLPSTPVWVLGDATRLTQVLDNLLENAQKFTDPGGQVTVTLMVADEDPPQRRRDRGEEKEGGETPRPDASVASLSSSLRPLRLCGEARCALVTVSDTGIGIEPEMLPRLFDVFSQADRTLDRSRGGLGLGLALVKGLMELHGGSAAAASAGIGRGAEFVMRLPLEPEPPVFADRRAAVTAPGGDLRILLIEDNRDAAETLKDLLELYGYQVSIAHSGPAGLAVAAAVPPDVIICDIGLPEMDGYAVARALRAHPQLAGTRLIALTGYGQETDIEGSKRAGFDEHLVKPVDPNQLLRRLQAS